jgi:Lrp/AsnC family transcriptional regulator, leucine-responsive regulatory protein
MIQKSASDEIFAPDALDLRLLEQLQTDASLSNLALAQAVHASAATCLRRVRKLQEVGLIQQQVAVLNPERLAEVLGHGLSAVVEVSLDAQGAERLGAFEARAVADPAVSQVLRVSPGPDFVLHLRVRHMAEYHALAQRLFASDANVRNVKTYFVTHQAKFSTALPLG